MERRLRIANAALLAVFIGWLAAISFFRPTYNWDMIPYAVLVSGDFHGAWALVKSYVSPEKFQELCCSGEYRLSRFSNPAALQSDLPMYTIKIGYIWLAKILSVVADPIRALQIVSFVGATVVAVAGFAAFNRLNGTYRFLWLPAVLLLHLPYLARLSTPDALATAFFAVSGLCVLGGSIGIGAALALAGLLVRPDSVIVCLFLAGYLVLQKHRMTGLTLAGCALLAYFAITLSVDHIGWWKHFYFTHIGRTDEAIAFDLKLYLWTVIRTANMALHSYVWIATVLLCVCVAFRRFDRHSREQQFMLAMLGAVAAHFVIFPIWDGRVYSVSLFPLVFSVPFILSRRSRMKARTSLAADRA